MCNTENVKYSIELMNNAKNFTMVRWQDGCAFGEAPPIQTIEGIHSCGMSACFGGYVALSDKFQSDGGTVSFDGAPTIYGEVGEWAIATWLNISVLDARNICGLGDRNEWGGDAFYSKSKEYITPQDVVEKLEEMLAGCE